MTANLPRAEVFSSRDSGGEAMKISLGMALGGHNNSLGFIRLVLASLVIFDHAFPLGGYGADIFFTITRGQASLGSVAVAGFFAISGYLIAKSGLSADVVQFMWRRFLRIFPAYWAVLIVTALVVAPIIWIAQGDSVAAYFRIAPNGPWHYLAANWTLKIGTYGIYDLLTTSTPYGREIQGSAFNGSIWTLIYEWNAYLLIAILVAFGVLHKARIVVPLITIFLFVIFIFYSVSQQTVAALIPWLNDPYRIQLTLTFMLGACLAVYSKQIPYSNGLGLLSGLVMFFTLRYGGFAVVGTAAGVYFVMYLGVRLPKVLQQIGQKNDYSYGVYIYGFLVQMVLAQLGVYKWGYFPYSILALIISFGCAWLSWHLIEKRAMALKDWGPGRGWRFWFDRFLTRRRLRLREV